MPRRGPFAACIVSACAAALSAGCGVRDARHEVAVPWALTGQSLVADLHTHTRFSDGSLALQDLATKAAGGGCEVLAITDHGTPHTKTATPEYFEAAREARGAHPRLILFAGMEWNIPPHKGREHVGVLVDPALEATLLPEFRRMFERKDAAAADEALRWLHGKVKSPAQVWLIYHHPTRVPGRTPASAAADFIRWRAISPSMAGFEGAPGHQKSTYASKPPHEHRWDVVASQIGGAWDALLDAGNQVWAATASSDYHGETDYPPCTFSRTYIQVPERTHTGVLQALHAGTYWAVHGDVLRYLLFTVSAPGLAVPAAPGETIAIGQGATVTARVALERGHGGDGPLSVEIIGNCRAGKPGLIATLDIEPGRQETGAPVPNLRPGSDAKSCYLRVRVRKKSTDGDDLLAYTNPVRLRLR